MQSSPRSRSARRMVAALGASVCLMLTGCAVFGGESPLPPMRDGNASTDRDQVSMPYTLSSPSETYSVGDTIVIANTGGSMVWEITVNSVLTGADAERIVSDDPAEGRSFVVFDCTFTLLKGQASTDVHLYLDAVITGDDGQEYNASSGVEAIADEDYFLLPRFSAGSTQNGQILLSVPEGTDVTEWRFVFDGSNGEWVFTTEV
ncbi:hypothetical protein [Humidisolicoccus flavus]|uniref:hypothetical protein n=1 Tax=Humidisolicoccus flavus TaxID=3111414 RepID=UPI00324EC9FF